MSKKVPKRRSPRWAAVRDAFLKDKSCAACGRHDRLQAHHVIAFHEDRSRELDTTNLLPLCEGGSRNCHLWIGHLFDFAAINPHAVADAAHWLAKVKAR